MQGQIAATYDATPLAESRNVAQRSLVDSVRSQASGGALDYFIHKVCSDKEAKEVIKCLKI